MFSKIFRRSSSRNNKSVEATATRSYPSSPVGTVFATDKCERCDVTGVPILYGYPSPDAEMAAGRGEIAFGGCAIYGGEPRFECSNCKVRWRVAGSESIN